MNDELKIIIEELEEYLDLWHDEFQEWCDGLIYLARCDMGDSNINFMKSLSIEIERCLTYYKEHAIIVECKTKPVPPRIYKELEWK